MQLFSQKSSIIDISEGSKAWFPPGDTFLEIEIKTIATFILRR